MKISGLEEDKLLLLEFIHESDLRLPKNLRMKLQHDIPITSTARAQRNFSGYAEEVDVEVIKSKSSIVNYSGPYSSQKDIKSKPSNIDQKGFIIINIELNAFIRISSLGNGTDSSRPRSATPNKLNISKQTPVINKANTIANTLSRNKNDTMTMTSSWSRSSRSSRYSNNSDDANSDKDNSYYNDLLAQDQNTQHSFDKHINEDNDRDLNRQQNIIKYDNTHRITDHHNKPAMKSNFDNGITINLESTNSNSKSVLNFNQNMTVTNSFNTKTLSNTVVNHPTDREEQQLSDGTRIIKYSNGTVKELRTDGTTMVKFTNGVTEYKILLLINL